MSENIYDPLRRTHPHLPDRHVLDLLRVQLNHGHMAKHQRALELGLTGGGDYFTLAYSALHQAGMLVRELARATGRTEDDVLDELDAQHERHRASCVLTRGARRPPD